MKENNLRKRIRKQFESDLFATAVRRRKRIRLEFWKGFWLGAAIGMIAMMYFVGYLHEQGAFQ